MTYTADYLIESRKDKWNSTHSIDQDKELRYAIAEEIIKDSSLREEIIKYPEKLIELVFVVVDKKQRTMPFFLNSVQQKFIDSLNKAKDDFEAGLIPEISLLVLKGRQQGFTTLITAYQLASSILNKNFQGFTLADKSDNSEAIFQNKAKFPYSQLPPILKPTEKFNNRRQLLFEKLNSSWAVDTATNDVGRSRTVNFFHGSECAFWNAISPVQAGLGEAFTKNCIKIWETTANGYNDYEKMWHSGAHINCFYEWWQTPEYRIEFPSEDAKKAFLISIDASDKWINTRLQWLRNSKGLNAEQLYWYFNKYQGYIDKRLIRQEYPCSPEEAFISSGDAVFDSDVLHARIDSAPEPLKIGYFSYDYDGMRITNIRWHNDRNGYIRLYGLPNTPRITKYCIGGDTSGEGSDYFTAHVLDAATGEQVAALKQQFDADQYSKQMYCLGKYYKDALIGIESNFDSYPLMELQRLGYYNQYVREKLDEYTGKTEKRFGFRTTSLTRPTIISRLIEIVREHCETINDKDTLLELLAIIRNEKGRIEAPEGGHDDQMMGLAIAHQIREQVVFDTEPINMDMTYMFNFEKQEVEYGEAGSTIVVI